MSVFSLLDALYGVCKPYWGWEEITFWRETNICHFIYHIFKVNLNLVLVQDSSGEQSASDNEPRSNIK